MGAAADALRQDDAGHRPGGQVARVEHHALGLVGVHVGHEADHITVVLGLRIVAGRHGDSLPKRPGPNRWLLDSPVVWS
jgi:hypothetical protein